MRLVILCLVVGATMVLGERPKIKDTHGNLLVKISDIPIGSCGDDTYFGLGIMDGGLEECSRWKIANHSDNYEEYKCKVLRVHAHIDDGKCVCDEKWKGPICNEYDGCPEGHSLFGKVCTPNVCQNGGSLAVGKKEIECICPPPWDDRFCNRLACWRKTTQARQHRYRNSIDHCVCGNHYTGEQCDIVTSCLNNGELVNGACKCTDGWHGELCERRCPKGQTTCSACTINIILCAMLAIVAKFVF